MCRLASVAPRQAQHRGGAGDIAFADWTVQSASSSSWRQLKGLEELPSTKSRPCLRRGRADRVWPRPLGACLDLRICYRVVDEAGSAAAGASASWSWRLCRLRLVPRYHMPASCSCREPVPYDHGDRADQSGSRGCTMDNGAGRGCCLCLGSFASAIELKTKGFAKGSQCPLGGIGLRRPLRAMSCTSPGDVPGLLPVPWPSRNHVRSVRLHGEAHPG